MTKLLGPARSSISVLVVIPDNMTGELLKNAFTRDGKEFAVSTLVGTSQSVIDRLERYSPHVVVVSEALQDGEKAGLKVVKNLQRSCPGASAIMILKHSKSEGVVDAFRHGVRGVVSRDHSLKNLSKCIRVVSQGQIWLSNEGIENVVNAITRANILTRNCTNGSSLLTRRQEDIVRLIADGMKNREIAQRLEISEHSVRNYVHRIFEKLGLSSRIELILNVMNQRGKPN